MHKTLFAIGWEVKYFMTKLEHNSYFNFSQECNATLHHILFLFVALDKISLCEHWHITSAHNHLHYIETSPLQCNMGLNASYP
jgi:hypothetical protein